MPYHLYIDMHTCPFRVVRLGPYIMILEVNSIRSSRKGTFRSTLYTAYPKLPNEGKEEEKNRRGGKKECECLMSVGEEEVVTKRLLHECQKSNGVKRTIRICIEKQSGIKKVAYDHHEKTKGVYQAITLRGTNQIIIIINPHLSIPNIQHQIKSTNSC